jgi:hypothetical protein
MTLRKRVPSGIDLLGLDWEAIHNQLKAADPKSDGFYMIVVNKGKPDEYRTRFMNHQEAMELVCMALEKKKLRVPITL